MLTLSVFSDMAFYWYMHQFIDHKLLVENAVLSAIRFIMYVFIFAYEEPKNGRTHMLCGNMFSLFLWIPMQYLVPWRICSHWAHAVFVNPSLAPLRLKGWQPPSNTCIVTHNACPIFQSECAGLTFWHVHVCIPASPLNPAGTSQHSYGVICEELWVRIRWAKAKGVWGKGAITGVLFLISRLQISGNYKSHLGSDDDFPFPNISLKYLGQNNHKDMETVFAMNGVEARIEHMLDSYNGLDNKQGICICLISFKSHNSTARQVVFDAFRIWRFWPKAHVVEIPPPPNTSNSKTHKCFNAEHCFHRTCVDKDVCQHLRT